MGTVTVRTRSLVWFALGIVTALIAVAVWMSAWSADAAPGDSDTTVVPITSCRLTDTRPNFQVGPRNTPLGAEETYLVEVQNASTECVGKVPASATGLLLNVTAVQASQPTFLSIWDQGPFPGTSSLNPVPGPPVPNAVTTKLADDDTFRVYNLAGTTHVIVDIVGYLTPVSLQALAGSVGTPGPKGDTGARGPAGPVNRITDEQIAKLAWYEDPGAASTIPVGDEPTGLAFDGTNVYVTNLGSNNVSVINPATNTVSATIPVGNAPSGVAFDGTSIYVTNQTSGNVSVINPATNTVIDTIPVGGLPYGVAFGGTNVYVTNSGSGNVSVINPATNTVIDTIPVGTQPWGVAFDGTNVYVANRLSNNVSVINPTTDTVIDTIPVGSLPRGVAFDGAYIYVANRGSGNVSVINPATNTVIDTIPVGSLPEQVAFDGTNLYVTNFGSNDVSKLIPR